MGQDGTILDSLSDPASIGGNVFDDVRRMGRNDLAEKLPDVARGRAGIVRLPGILIPETVWIAHAPLRSMRVSVVTAVPQTVALAFERTQIRAGLLILTDGLVVILVAVFVASTFIMRPVSRLAEAVSDLGRGDLDTRIGAVESRDEIGELARAFDKMVADLKHHVAALQRETAAREAVLSELRVAAVHVEPARIQAMLADSREDLTSRPVIPATKAAAAADQAEPAPVGFG